MEIRHVKTLVAIMKEGNFTRAPSASNIYAIKYYRPRSGP